MKTIKLTSSRIYTYVQGGDQSLFFLQTNSFVLDLVLKLMIATAFGIKKKNLFQTIFTDEQINKVWWYRLPDFPDLAQNKNDEKHDVMLKNPKYKAKSLEFTKFTYISPTIFDSNNIRVCRQLYCDFCRNVYCGVAWNTVQNNRNWTGICYLKDTRCFKPTV